MSFRLRWLWPGLIIFLAACQPVSSPGPESAATTPDLLPLDSSIVTGQLDNGLTYYIRPNRKPENRVELRLVVNAGSILEREDQQGLAHLVEHMAFNGTTHFPKQKLVDYLERIGMRFGADVNAYTSFDETVYMLEVPTEEETYIDTGLQVLRDWAGDVAFDPEEVDKERGVVKEEWRLGRGADARLRDKTLPVMVKDSRYAVRLPIGQPEVLDTARYETLTDFYHTWYRPDLMAVVVVGTIDPRRMESAIRMLFSDLKNPDPEKPRVLYPVPDHDEPLTVVATDPEAAYTVLQWIVKQPSREQGSRESYVSDLRERLFTSMFSNRLDELRQKPDSPFLYSYTAAGPLVRTKDAFQLVTLVKEGKIESALETLAREVERVRRYGFTATEFERAKKKMIRSYEQALKEADKTESRSLAAELIRHFLTAEPVPGIAYETALVKEVLPRLTLEEVNALADQLMSRKNTVLAVTGMDKAGLTYPAGDELLAVRERVLAESIDPYVDRVSEAPLVAHLPPGGSIVAEDRIDAIDAYVWTCANGVRVCAKPTDFKNDQILFTAFSPGGGSLVPDDRFIQAVYATGIVTAGGAGTFDRIQLEKKLSGKVVSVRPYMDDLWEGFEGSSSREDLTTLFQLIWLYGTEPRKDSTAFLSYRQRVLDVVSHHHLQPEAAYRDSITALVNGHHIRARFPSEDDIRSLNLDQAFQIYRDRFADFDDFTFVFVGSFDPDTLRTLVSRWLGPLPTHHREEQWRDVGMVPPEGSHHTRVYRGQEPKSLTHLEFIGDVPWSPRAEYVASSLAQALRIKLREVIREEESGTYGVRVSARLTPFPHNQARLRVSFGADPSRIDDLVEEVQTRLDSVALYGLPEIYLEKVKETQRRAFETSRKKNGFWLEKMTRSLRYGLPLDEVLRLPEMIESLTMDEMVQLAHRLIREDHLLRVTLYPEEMENQP